MKNAVSNFVVNLAVATAFLVSNCASAVIIYSDETSFQNDNVVTSILTPASGGNGTIAGPLSFTNGPSASIVFGNYTGLLTNELAISNVENFNVNIAGGAYAFGFDVSDPAAPSGLGGCNVSTCIDSQFILSIFNGSTLINSFAFDPMFSNSVLSFVGFYSNIIFNRVEVRETLGTNDNEYFGNFQVGVQRQASEPNQVSEPETLMLMMLSMLSVLFLRRKKNTL